jgi:hypothetical protein
LANASAANAPFCHTEVAAVRVERDDKIERFGNEVPLEAFTVMTVNARRRTPSFERRCLILPTDAHFAATDLARRDQAEGCSREQTAGCISWGVE